MIREAAERDRMRVLMMARDFHAASGIPVPFSAAYANSLFTTTLSDENRLCLVYAPGDVAQGVLAAQVTQLAIASVKAATEIMWWIEPAHRGRAAIQMLEAYEAWARERGCQFANMVGLGNDPEPARLYERRGYTPAERHFVKQL